MSEAKPKPDPNREPQIIEVQECHGDGGFSSLVIWLAVAAFAAVLAGKWLGG